MSTRIRICLCELIVMGLVLILTNNCKKDKDDNNPSETITDVEGNIYKTIIIGTQVWMAENLKTTKYQNGDLIGTTTPVTLDVSAEATPKYQWASRDGDESKVDTYGRLYTWYAVTDSRNLCPTGWHVPTDAEWTTLTNFLGGDEIAGGKLKEAGTTHWAGPDSGATNESGFTALPSGSRNGDGTFDIMTGWSCYWWSSTEYSTSTAFACGLDFSLNIVYRGNNYLKHQGFSVRCLKDS